MTIPAFPNALPSGATEDSAQSIALHFMYYNFARVHMTLRSTTAMMAGITDHLWSIEDIVGLRDNRDNNSN